MVYNTLKKIFLGSNHLLTITMATMMHPKSQYGQLHYEGLFCIKIIKKKSVTIKSKMLK